VDEVLEEVYRKLVGEDAALKIAFLQEPDDIPPEERTEDFISALEHAKVSDIEYLTQLEELEQAGRDDETALASIERELRSKVRAQREQDLLAEVQGVDDGEHREDENARRADTVWRCFAPRDRFLGAPDLFGFDRLLNR
jgi:hypothetical protein